LQANTFITTAGDGAYGVLAQSIGGGGGVAGDLSAILDYQDNTAIGVRSNTGDGGAVSVTANGASIQTSGSFAPAIFAQSIGGGGGLLNYNLTDNSRTKVLAIGSANGSGSGGAVTVSLTNSRVIATGAGSSAIFAQSAAAQSLGLARFRSPRPKFARPRWPARPSPPRRCRGHPPGRWHRKCIFNAGKIHGDASAHGGIAILTNTLRATPPSQSRIDHWRHHLKDGAPGLVDNRPGGVIDAPVRIDLAGGLLRNGGTLHVGGAGTVGTTTVSGDVTQTATGNIRIDVDARNGRADLLEVTGKVVLAGAIVVNPISLAIRKGTTGPVITAADGISGVPGVEGLATPIFTQSAVVTGNALAIATDADFRSNDPATSAAQRSLAGHLQRIWDSGSPGFDRDSRASPDCQAGSHTSPLDALSGQEVAAVASARFEASQNFARNAFNCRPFAEMPSSRTANDCAWLRADGAVIDHDASGGFPAYQWRAGA
jgi:hypothetical protein